MSTAQPTETPTPITDEEVAKFLKEFDEGKHPLTDAEKDALATVGFRRQLQMSIELKRLRAFEQGALVRYDTYEKTVATLTAQLEEARRDSARLDFLNGSRSVVTSWPIHGGAVNYHIIHGGNYFEATSIRAAIDQIEKGQP
jgi:hypothetical protein